MYYWLIIGILTLVLLPVLYFKKSSNWCIILLYIAGVFAFCPMFYSIYRLGGIPASLIFPAQLFTGGVEYKNFIEIINLFISVDDPRRHVIMITCTFIYVLAPIFTIGFVFDYVRKSFDSLFLRSLFCKNIYIFSEYNQNSLIFAKSIKNNNKKSIIVFSKSEKHPEYKGFLFAEFSVERICDVINKTNNIHIVFDDSNEDEALKRFFSFKENNNTKNVEVYVYSTKREAEYIIDEVKKTEENMKIQLVNTEQLLVLDTLWNYPLYMSMGDKKEFNITVFGVGNMGSSFVKDALWCTSLTDYNAKINLVDKGDAINNLVEKCPYINADENKLNVICENVSTDKLGDIIRDENIKNSNYIFISLGDDTLNIDLAERLRLEYSRMLGTSKEAIQPTIVTVIENDSKRKILENVFSKDHICLTGNISQFCDFEYMMKNNVFKFGCEIFKIVANHYSKDKLATDDEFCMQTQMEIYSSLSNAVHMKYKIFSLFGEKFDYERNNINKFLVSKDEKTLEKIKAERELLRNRIDENLDILSESEHKRWEKFERMKGFVGVDFDKLEEFIKNNRDKNKPQKDMKLKINACITDYNNLDKLYDYVKKHSENKELESFKTIDITITEKIPDIWYKEIEKYV